jgi:lactam utilization protein B
MFRKLAIQKTSTKLLVIVITAAAIVTMATTTSLSAATPAFARRNCNEDNTICSGDSGCGVAGCQAVLVLVIYPAEVVGGQYYQNQDK